MNEKDNARYWNEYHNLKHMAYQQYKKQDKILTQRLNDSEIDIDTYMNLHRIIYNDYENDPKVKEFDERHSIKIPKWQFWRKEKYIAGPNNDMKCIMCNFTMNDIYHTTLQCSTEITNKEFNDSMREFNEAQRKKREKYVTN